MLGAGAVGCEFASIFAHVGSETTIVEYLPHLLPIEDEDASQGAGEALPPPEDRLRALGAKVEKVETTAARA